MTGMIQVVDDFVEESADEKLFAIVRGSGNTTGIALVEVYNLP